MIRPAIACALPAVLAACALPASVSALTLNELAVIDLSSTAVFANDEYIGDNPSAVAWDGASLFVGGFNAQAPVNSPAPTSIVKVTDALTTPTFGTAFATLQAPAFNGYMGLDIQDGLLVASFDVGGNDFPTEVGLQAFNASDGSPAWDLSDSSFTALTYYRGQSGPAFDPGFDGVDSGVAHLRFNSGRRILFDSGTGATIYDDTNGMIYFDTGLDPQAGTVVRDLDFDPDTGDVYIREDNDVLKVVRSGGNSRSDIVRIVDNAGSEVNGQTPQGINLAYLSTPGGDAIVYNDRPTFSFPTAVTFDDVVGFADPDGNPIDPTINYLGAAPGDGVAYYDFDYDAASQTLAVLDFTNREARVFAVSTASEILGDYNDNGLVEQGDLNQVLNNWGVDFASVAATWINQRPTEGIVDQAELNVVLNRWGSDSAPDFSGGAVPEPMSLALLGVPALLLHRRR